MQKAVRISVLSAATVLVAGLAGCSSLSSLNPFASKPSPKSLPAPLVEFKSSMAVRTAWTNSVGNAGDYLFSPIVSGKSVYAASADGNLERLELDTGRVEWKVQAPEKLTAGVGTDGDIISVAGEKGSVYAFSSDGKQLWKAQTSSEVLSAPAVGQGLVVVRSLDNRIVAFDAKTGEKKWSMQRPVPPLTLRIAPGILIAGATTYAALPGGKLLAMVTSNGAPKWEVSVGDPRGATELERVADLGGAPVLSSGEVCAVSFQGKVACFDAANGAPRWSKDFSSVTGVAVDARYVFASDEHGVIAGYSRPTGASAWRNDKFANRKLSTPVSVGRAVAFGDFEGYIHFLSREDGAMLARLPTDGSPVLAAPASTDKYAIFQTKNGAVVAVATE